MVMGAAGCLENTKGGNDADIPRSQNSLERPAKWVGSEGQRIVELGPLEAGHTYMLESKSILALDKRTYLKSFTWGFLWGNSRYWISREENEPACAFLDSEM
jgi:hypothetical protein